MYVGVLKSFKLFKLKLYDLMLVCNFIDHIILSVYLTLNFPRDTTHSTIFCLFFNCYFKLTVD